MKNQPEPRSHNQPAPERRGQWAATSIPPTLTRVLAAGLAAVAAATAGAGTTAPSGEVPRAGDAAPLKVTSLAATVSLESRAGHGLNSVVQGNAPRAGVLLPLLMPLEPGLTLVGTNGVSSPIVEGWPPVVGGLSAMTHYVHNPGESGGKSPDPKMLAPFPNGVEMGLTGLGLALGVTLVRRHRLSVD